MRSGTKTKMIAADSAGSLAQKSELVLSLALLGVLVVLLVPLMGFWKWWLGMKARTVDGRTIKSAPLAFSGSINILNRPGLNMLPCATPLLYLIILFSIRIL